MAKTITATHDVSGNIVEGFGREDGGEKER